MVIMRPWLWLKVVAEASWVRVAEAQAKPLGGLCPFVIPFTWKRN